MEVVGILNKKIKEKTESWGVDPRNRPWQAGQPAVLHTGDSSIRNVTHFTCRQAVGAETD